MNKLWLLLLLLLGEVPKWGDGGVSQGSVCCSCLPSIVCVLEDWTGNPSHSWEGLLFR